jgi:hypothetical protein
MQARPKTLKSKLFHAGQRLNLETSIKGFLNSQPAFLTAQTAQSPRAVGDAVQTLLSQNLRTLLGEFCTEYSDSFARRAMADLAFTDTDGLYYRVDVKTHNVETHFNMPNLTSVERLTRFYEDDINHFCVLFVGYRVAGNSLRVEVVHFVPIEFLSWDCLTIGALGWGQIQIANSNNIVIVPDMSRKTWMLTLCEVMLEFYPREIGKISERIKFFEKVKSRWQVHEE